MKTLYPWLTPHLVVRDWKFSPLKQKRELFALFCHCYSTLYLNFSQKNWTRKSDKNYSNCKGRCKIISVHWWHNYIYNYTYICIHTCIHIHRKCLRIYKEATWIEQYMNVVTLQDRRWRHKIQSWFCTPAVNSPQRKVYFIYNFIFNSI